MTKKDRLLIQILIVLIILEQGMLLLTKLN